MRPAGPDGYATYVPRMLFHVPPSPTFWEQEGTLVFADVSGFTRLSERLARQGRIGAEELVTIISNVFTELLSATDDGGDVLKFGGDALLVFHRGPDHALRAAHASLGMQRALVRAGRIVSAHGRVRLRMSVGVHSGMFPFLLVGHEHLELVVTGPEATRTVELESDAEPGEILVSPGTAEMLPPGAVATTRSGRLRLRNVPALPPRDGSEATSSPTVDLSPYIPILLRGRVGPETAEHEHRQVTVSFVHFAGVDELIRRRGLDATFDRLQGLAEAVETVTSELGVTIITTDIGPDGGKYYLAAGTPHASDDDEGRMLHACRRIVDADVGLRLRAGINRGHVFGGDVGAPFRRTYSVMGDTVNLAARIMGKASFGTVLAERSVVEQARARFHIEEVEPFTVKGKTEPVQAMLVHTIAEDVDLSTSIDELPLVGRDQELEVLRTAAVSAASGAGGVVEIVGEAGLGKSRIVRELLRSTNDLRTIEVACDPVDRTAPFFASRILLRKALDIPLTAGDAETGSLLLDRIEEHAPRVEPWAPLLARAAGGVVPPTAEVEDLAAQFRTERLRSAVAELLRAVLGPSLIVIEDAFWMDDASADALRDVLTDAPGLPWLVILTRRDETSGLHTGLGFTARTLRLEPLQASDVTTLTAHLIERKPLPPAQLDAVAQRAGGSPLFLLELFNTVGGEADDLPPTVEAVLASRIDSLAPPDRRVLRYVSVLGSRFSGRILDRSFGELGVSSDDRGLWRRLEHFVTRDGTGTFRFHHDLVRETAYEGLTFRRRRELHGRVARAYEAAAVETQSDHSAVLALHFHRAGMHEPAWRYSVAAGDRARENYANSIAARFYEQALDAGTHQRLPEAELTSVAERLGDVLDRAGSYEEADRAYRRARKHDVEVPRLVGLMRKQGRLRERRGELTNALRWYGRALRIAGSIDDAGTRRACQGPLEVASAVVRFRQARFRQCIELCRRAVENAEATGDLETLAYALYVWEASQVQLEPAGEDSRFWRALAIYEQLKDLLGQANVWDNLGVQAYYQGHWDTARDRYERSREAARRAGDVVGAAVSSMNIAEILCDQGHVAAAEGELLRARIVLRGSSYLVMAAVCDSYLGRTALRAGRAEEALRLLDDAAEELADLGSDAYALEVRIRSVEALLAVGDLCQAKTRIEASLADAARGHNPALLAMGHRLYGLTSATLGDLGAAETTLEASLDIARREGLSYELATTLRTMSSLSLGDPVSAELEAAVLYERMGIQRPVAVQAIPDVNGPVGSGLSAL